MNIRPFCSDDFDRAVAAMVDAFAEDALYRYFVEDPSRRRAFLERFMRFRLRYGLARGTAFVTEDVSAVAVWLRPDSHMTPFDLIRFGGLRAMLLCDKAERTRIMGFNDYADALMAQHAPGSHWHLSPICVAPAAQRRGYGRALMEYGLEQLCAGGPPCCLETQSARAAAFYTALGFQTLTAETVPGTSLTHYVMSR